MMAVIFKSKYSIRLIQSLLIFVIVSFGHEASYAQEGANKIPELEGHVFLPNTLIEDPFNNTYMDISVGLASTGQFKYPVFEAGGKTFYADRGQLLFVNVGLIYQQKIQDWASMHIKYFLSARLGTNVGSILSQGFSTINAFQIGWKLKLAERKRYRLSTTFGISNYNGTFLSVSGLIDDIIDEDPNPTLVTNVPALTGDLGLHFAYSISQLFGLKLTYMNSMGESLERGQTNYLYSLGASADVNFYQKHDVPIGLSLAYVLSNHPEQVFREGSISNGFKLKLAYTGTTDFIIGLQTSYIFIPVSEFDGNFTAIGFAFNLTYYFN